MVGRLQRQWTSQAAPVGTCRGCLARPVHGNSRSPLLLSDLVPTTQFLLSHTALPVGHKVPKMCNDATFLLLYWVRSGQFRCNPDLMYMFSMMQYIFWSDNFFFAILMNSISLVRPLKRIKLLFPLLFSLSMCFV